MTRLIVVALAAVGFILFVAFVAARLLRSRTRGLSVRMQIFLALAAIVGAFAFGLGLMVIDRIESRAVRLASQAATDEAVVIASMIGSEIARSGESVEDIAGRFPSEQMLGPDFTVELRDVRGKLLFPHVAGPAEVAGTVSVEVPLVAQGARVGVVRVVKPTLVIRRMLEDFAPTVMVISLVLGAAAAIAAAWIGRAIAAPIEALSVFSQRVSQGERSASPPLGFGREVTRLTQSIDSMRRQLEGRPFVETFAADLSHELKNPVAAIRASAEVLDESALDDPVVARKFVTRIREATLRIERLLKDLLSLASIEARGVEAFEPIDLSRVVLEVVDASEERGRITVSAERDTRVRGDPSWLSRALSNLIDNALVHSPDGSKIRVGVGAVGDSVVVSVVNAGSVPRHVAQRVFSRFVTTRADKGGSGLGLAIVRAVAEAHRGRAEMAQPGPPEVEFRLVFPEARLFAGVPSRGLTEPVAAES